MTLGIIAILVFLCRLKTSLIINLILTYISLNQFRKGYTVWGIIFLIITLLKFLNLFKMYRYKKLKRNFSDNYKKYYKDELKNRYFGKKKNLRLEEGFEDLLDKIGLGNILVPDEIIRQKRMYNQQNKEFNEMLIKRNQAQRRIIKKEKSKVEKEVREEITDAYQKKLEEEWEVNQYYNSQNRNIPEDLYLQDQLEGAKYKEILEDMYNDSYNDVYTEEPYSKQIKDIAKGSYGDIDAIRNEIKIILSKNFELDDKNIKVVKYGPISESINMDWMKRMDYDMSKRENIDIDVNYIHDKADTISEALNERLKANKSRYQEINLANKQEYPREYNQDPIVQKNIYQENLERRNKNFNNENIRWKNSKN